MVTSIALPKRDGETTQAWRIGEINRMCQRETQLTIEICDRKRLLEAVREERERLMNMNQLELELHYWR